VDRSRGLWSDSRDIRLVLVCFDKNVEHPLFLVCLFLCLFVCLKAACRELALIPSSGTKKFEILESTGWVRGEFRPRQLPRAVDLKGQLLSSQSY